MANFRVARASGQQNLFELVPKYNIESNAHARNVYGLVAQEIACRALNLREIGINGNCYV